MTRPIHRCCLIVAMAAFCLTGTATSARATRPADKSDNPHLWKPETKSVAIFKNGYGFFMREGNVSLRNGWCQAGEIPPATFGTLAIYSHDENEIVDIVGAGPGETVAFDGRDADDDLDTRRQRLEAAKNLKVQLHYTDKDTDRTASGRVISIGPDYVVLDNDQGNAAVPIAGISRMHMLDLPMRVHVESQADTAPEDTTLGMAYLRQGIIWIPEYTMKILDDETAELTLRGTIVNEAEDLIDCNVHFVVFVPNFLHTCHMAPIAMGQAIRTIGSAIAPSQIMNQIASNNFIVSNGDFSNLSSEGVVIERPLHTGSGAINNLMGNLPHMDGGAASDFTVYTKEGLTLRRGEKAIVTLFVKRIRYTHVYRWSLPQRMKHFLTLINDTDTAWTTGPCLALSDHRPLSEDLLRYTPKGGRCDIPVTTSINIAHTTDETEVDRELKNYSPGNNFHLDRVTLEGKLKLRNYEQREVKVFINRVVPGKPLSASDNGKTSVDTSKLKLVEREGRIGWEIELAPDEAKTLTYQYERYVPSR